MRLRFGYGLWVALLGSSIGLIIIGFLGRLYAGHPQGILEVFGSIGIASCAGAWLMSVPRRLEFGPSAVTAYYGRMAIRTLRWSDVALVRVGAGRGQIAHLDIPLPSLVIAGRQRRKSIAVNVGLFGCSRAALAAATAFARERALEHRVPIYGLASAPAGGQGTVGAATTPQPRDMVLGSLALAAMGAAGLGAAAAGIGGSGWLTEGIMFTGMAAIWFLLGARAKRLYCNRCGTERLFLREAGVLRCMSCGAQAGALKEARDPRERAA